MAIINITSADKNNILFEKEGKPFGAIKFEGFFKSDITAISAGNKIYEFTRAGFWNDKYVFKQGEEQFVTAKFLPFGKMAIENLKNGAQFRLKVKSFFREEYILEAENGEVLFHIKVKRGFFVTIKGGEIDTTPLFDSINDQFLICSAALLLIEQKIGRTAAIAS